MSIEKLSKHDFKELKVWQKCRVFTKDLYSLSYSFPNDEKFGITNQVRRATVSISNNIAEGAGRNSKKEFKQFLHIAYGSAVEVENMLILVSDLNFVKPETITPLYNDLMEIQKMLFGLIGSIK